MSPRLLWLSVLPILALSTALSRADGPPVQFPDAEMEQQLHQAEQLARHAGQELLRSFEMLQSAIPRYGVPYIDEHGNIVIPRRPRLMPPALPTTSAT